MSNKYVDYYQSANFRDNSGAIAHYRTIGSKNGYSKDPNYTPIGEKANPKEKYRTTTGLNGGGKKPADEELYKEYSERQALGARMTSPTGGTGGKKSMLDVEDPSLKRREATLNLVERGQTGGKKFILDPADAKKEDLKAAEKKANELHKVTGGGKKSMLDNEWESETERKADKSLQTIHEMNRKSEEKNKKDAERARKENQEFVKRTEEQWTRDNKPLKKLADNAEIAYDKLSDRLSDDISRFIEKTKKKKASTVKVTNIK